MQVPKQSQTGTPERTSRRQARQPAQPRPSARAAPVSYEEEDIPALFTLSAEDLVLARTARTRRNQLGLALLLVWARSERWLLSDPATVPADVISFVARQLDLSPGDLKGYASRRATRSAHVDVVCRHLGVRSLGSGDQERLVAFLEAKVAQTGDAAALREAAEDWILRERLLEPAEATLERLVTHARAEAEERLFVSFSDQLTEPERAALDALCEPGEDGESTLAAIRVPPRAPSGSSIRAECRKLATIRAVPPRRSVNWGEITANRRRQWARVVRRLYAQALRRYPPAKRHTLLCAFLAVRAEEVTDAIVEMFDAVIGRILGQTGDDLVVAKAEQVDASSEGVRLFRLVAEVLLDASIPEDAVRREVFSRVTAEQLGVAVERTNELDRPQAETFLALLKDRFPYVRTFVPEVLSTLHFEGAKAETDLLKGIEALRTMGNERRRRVPESPPMRFVPARLRPSVVVAGGVDRRAWELCLLSEMRAALRAGELTVSGSRRYTPWDAGLYTPEAWAKRRASWFAERGRPAEGDAYVSTALEDLHSNILEAARALPDNTAARVEGGKIRLDALESLDLPPAVEGARRRLAGLLPLVDLAELLMEVDRWTGFSRALSHLSARGEPTLQYLGATRPALFAVLVAEATNMGLETMARASGIPYAQLVRVHDWCFREEALAEAISVLIAYHQGLPLTASFGPGTTSSSDGMRFGASASVLHARHLPRYFGVRRGVSVYSHVSDQGPQFSVKVISSHTREATHLMDGVLHQDAYRIEEHYSDTHGYTDLVFGLCEALGLGFAPRLRDLPDQVIYRARKGADCGPLNSVLRRSIRHDLIVEHWDEINRVAASLKDGLVAPSLLVAKLQSLRRQNPLQQAMQELGRLPKTRHILSYVNDPALRRRVLVGLNKQERTHSMARAICFGRQGKFPDRDYEGQLNRASALSLTINALVVWNTRYLAAAGEHLAETGEPVPREAWVHVSPLLWEHVHLLGRYKFEEPDIRGDLRPLRIRPERFRGQPDGREE